MNYHYFVFGLNIQSEIELPALIKGDSNIEPDVKITIGKTPQNLVNCQKKGVAYEIAPNEFLLDLKDIARFYVANGNSITIERKGGNPDDITLFLQGSCFGAVLHQRKVLAMHASAIVHEGEAVLFTGISGAGKSTTANAFRLQGYKMLTDDVCPVKIINGLPYALPGYPQSKLWEDALEKLEVDFENLKHIREGLNKRAVPLSDDFVREPMPIKAMYIIRRYNDSVKLIDIEDADKFRLVKNMTYRRYLLKDMGMQPYHFINGSKLANAIPIKIIMRSQIDSVKEVMETIQKDLSEN